jgi:hypothetical protein
MNQFTFIKNQFAGLLFISVILLANNIQAQTIEGKWTQASSKQFLTEEGIKSHGTSVLKTDMSTIGVVVYTFKADHTYRLTSTSVRNPKPRIFNGTWSLTGDTLTMTSNGISVKSKMIIQGNELSLDTAYPNSDITTNVVVTFKKG